MQIKAAMEEQNEGSKQITDALHNMNDSTVEVRNASTEMEEGNKMILDEVRNLQNATLVMTQSMEEMKIGASKINETGSSLSTISNKVKDSIVQIGTQVDQFKVKRNLPGEGFHWVKFASFDRRTQTEEDAYDN